MIETERLILRPFIEADAEDLYEYLTEPKVACFACMKIDSAEQAKEEARKRNNRDRRRQREGERTRA